MLALCGAPTRDNVVKPRSSCVLPCCETDPFKPLPLRVQPTIVFDRMAMLPSACDVTVTVETLEQKDNARGRHHLAAVQDIDGTFSWAEAVRFEVKASATMVIKVQVVKEDISLISWFSNSRSHPSDVFHATTKTLAIQEMQRAWTHGAEHFSFDLVDAASARVIGKVILKSPFVNTMIRSIPLKDPNYQRQYGTTYADLPRSPRTVVGGSVMPETPRVSAAMTQFPEQTGASSQHATHPYHIGGA